MMMVVYLWCLGVMVGMELAAGIFVAPVIFFPQKLLGEGVLSHFQSGLLMTDIFVRMEMILLIFCIVSFVYELYLWLSKSKSKDQWALWFMMSACVCAGLFILYYTRFIQQAQLKGSAETMSEAFRVMHKHSEWAMKALVMSQILLFLRRAFLMKSQGSKGV